MQTKKLTLQSLYRLTLTDIKHHSTILITRPIAMLCSSVFSNTVGFIFLKTLHIMGCVQQVTVIFTTYGDSPAKRSQIIFLKMIAEIVQVKPFLANLHLFHIKLICVLNDPNKFLILFLHMSIYNTQNFKVIQIRENN